MTVGGPRPDTRAEQLYRTRQDLRVLLTSAYAADMLADLVLRQEVSFMSKPYTPHDLASRIRETLDGNGNMEVRDRTVDGPPRDPVVP